MDSMRIYHCLSNIKSALESYPTQKKTAQEIENLVTQLSSNKYRVAVIGEFNRGKSSLVNSLLGIEVLPTAILPTTAVINRIVYDADQKIVIHYKDGNMQESSLDTLKDFATKIDKEKEKIALNIRRIDVHYPSVFSKNGIELIDTPGLNEDEKMTETTLSVLEHIDTAIVVISALMPLSFSEQKLICDLIEQKDIYHLTFVISFIDKISNDPHEQDDMVDYIAQRIKNETYALFCNTHDDAALLEKADYILKEPKVFGLSAKQAMQGFIKNDNKLLNASRFPSFKLELTALLTATQEQDLLSKIKRIAEYVKDNFQKSHEEYVQQITVTSEQMNTALKNANLFVEKDSAELSSAFLEMDKKLKTKGISYSRIYSFPTKLFSQCQNATFLKGNSLSLPECCEKISIILDDYEKSIQKVLTSEMERIFSHKVMQRQKNGFDLSQFLFSYSQWNDQNPIPTFSFRDKICSAPSKKEMLNAVVSCYQQYRRDILDYCVEWRKFMFLQNADFLDAIKQNAKMFEENINTLNRLLEKVTQQYTVNSQAVLNYAEELIRL